MPERLLIIVNPRGGKGKGPAILERVLPIFKQAGISTEIAETEHQGHGAELAGQASSAGYDALCAVGGDGTLHEVINGLFAAGAGDKLPVGLIPAGSGNSVMRTLELQNPEDAARNIAAGRERNIDVVEVMLDGKVVYACNIVGWGLVTDILRRSERIRWLGNFRYTVASALELITEKRRVATLIGDSEKWEGEFSFVLACNTRFTGNGMLMAPEASLDDGKIDLVVVQRATRFEMAQLLPKVFNGSYLASELADYRQVTQFEIIPEVDDTVNVDGELLERSPISAKVLPQALTLLI